MTGMDRELEVALVARLRGADPGAFDEVYERFNTRLFTFLARLSRRADVAEDLLDETWLRLVTTAPRLQPDTRLGAWLFTVARNLHASYRRSRLLEDSHAAGLIGLWPSGQPQPSPFESAALGQAMSRVDAALGTLPVKYREALLLVGVEGLAPGEAAEICGIAPEAMRQRLSRARAALAERLRATDGRGLDALNEVTT
jgi:RNA polymerase sigma-70 factor (ECF subfamily)